MENLNNTDRLDSHHRVISFIKSFNNADVARYKRGPIFNYIEFVASPFAFDGIMKVLRETFGTNADAMVEKLCMPAGKAPTYELNYSYLRNLLEKKVS